jgi:NADPH:quinone reductase-like Zn-dependent oxidoreductase
MSLPDTNAIQTGSTDDEVQISAEIPAWGAADSFAIAEHEVPSPGPSQVLVRTHNAGLNPVDAKVRAGAYGAAMGAEFPLVLGRDFSGTVIAVGADAEGGWSAGDEVVGTLAFNPALGSYSTHILTADAAMTRRPETVSPSDAAALPIAAMTAWQALHDVAKVQAGQKVLVQAGAGGVGHFAVQLAALAGCEVTATCSAHNAEFVLGLGASRAVDYNEAPFEEQVTGFDAVIDCVGGDVLERSYTVLKPGGIAVTMAARPDPEAAEKLGVRTELVFHRQDASLLADLLELVASGKLSVHVDASYPLAEVAAAHAVIEDGHVRGKLVLSTR